jgi:hypothetical protein
MVLWLSGPRNPNNPQGVKYNANKTPRGSSAKPPDPSSPILPPTTLPSLSRSRPPAMDLVDAGQRAAAPAADMDGPAAALPLSGAAYQPYVSELLSFSIERLDKVRSRLRALAAAPWLEGDGDPVT